MYVYNHICVLNCPGDFAILNWAIYFSGLLSIFVFLFFNSENNIDQRIIFVISTAGPHLVLWLVVSGGKSGVCACAVSTVSRLRNCFLGSSVSKWNPTYHNWEIYLLVKIGYLGDVSLHAPSISVAICFSRCLHFLFNLIVIKLQLLNLEPFYWTKFSDYF